MASNLSTIGFTFGDDGAFEETMVKLANQAQQRLETSAGDYAIWRSRTGAEIWFHLGARGAGGETGESGERAIIGLAPFYQGASDVRIAATELFQRPGDNVLEGLVHAWVEPDESGIGSYPLVFEAVDYAAHAGNDLPAAWRVRLACFCREIAVFDSVEALLASDEDTQSPQLAPQALLPIGLFGADGEGKATPGAGGAEVPEPTVLVRGVVKEHRRHQNEITGHGFHWMLVETYDATLDVVADADLLAREPAAGCAIEAYASVFGRRIG